MEKNLKTMKSRNIAIVLITLAFGIFTLPFTASAVVDWTKDDANNPVLSPDGPATWEQNWLNFPRVIKDGSTYKMWYMGGGPEAGTAGQIGYATSSNGTTWSKYGSNPVFPPGASGKFDEDNVFGACVIKEGTNDYKMWYAGNDIHDDFDNMQVGYATSLDGIAWARQNSGNPVLQKGGANDWDGDGVGGAVINDGGTYKMWYAGWNVSQGTYGIGYATSADGINWTKYDDGSTTTDPYAASDPVISVGPVGAWDHSWPGVPCVIKEDSVYRMWYNSYPGGTDDYDRIGYAYSLDGINWRKYDGNPVIMEGNTATDDFDEDGAMDPMVLKDVNTYKMWYSGVGWSGATQYAKFGYATSSAYQGSQPAINQMGVATLNLSSEMHILMYFTPEGPGPLDINELKVDGPSSFSYTFSDWDVTNVMGNQLPLVVFPDPANTGVYTFTVKANNGQTASNSVTLGGSTISVPQDGIDYLDRSVNDGTWNTSVQVYVGNSTPNFRWKPYLGDSYYYRVFIMDWRKRAVWYSLEPKLGSTKSGDYMSDQVPSGILKDNTPYYWLVEVLDTNNRWSAHNRSRSSWRQIYTGTKSGSADFLNDTYGKAGFVSERSFRTGDRASFYAFVHNLAPWDIDTTTNKFRVDGPGTSHDYDFNPDNDAFTTDPYPFMYFASTSGAPVNGTYNFYVYENGTSNHEDANIAFTIDNTVPQVRKDQMHHENVVTRIDNAYLPYADPELFWKSKGSGYWHRVIVFDWNYRRLVWRSDYMNGVTAGSDMSAQVPQGTLKEHGLYRWWVEVYDSTKQNRTRSQWLSFVTGESEADKGFLAAIYLLLLGD